MDENNKKKKKKKRTWEMVLNEFTDDLWIEILLRLPVESLLRFKSVSKSWLSIMSSHRFAKSHLETAPKDDQVVIVHHGFGDCNEYEDDTFSLFHLDTVRILENLKFPFSEGEYPCDEIICSLMGSDCGIVCVFIDLPTWLQEDEKDVIYLWNPTTKHSKLLPPCTTTSSRVFITGILGFGFDHIDFDFKVVMVSRSISAKVFSSNRNSWRSIESKLIDIPLRNRFDVCFHGFLFAVGENNGIMAFDLNKDLFIWDINLPVSSFSDGKSSIGTRVMDFKDTIAVTMSNMEQGQIQLWTLDDEACLCGGGVNALWTKVLTVDVGVALGFVEGLFNNAQFSLFDANGNKPFLYDLNKKVTQNFPDSPDLESCEIFKYTKSLFSLNGFKPVKWDASSSMLQNSSDTEMDE